MQATPLVNDNVIVIGSGFGGAVAAARLAEAGLSVTLLERGPWRDTLPVRSLGIAGAVPFPRGAEIFTRLLRSIGGNRPLPASLCLNARGLFEYYAGRGVGILCSSGVGGGSHVYSAVTVRPLVADYWDGHVGEISTATMEPHYRAVIERLAAVTPTAAHRIPNLTAVRFRDSPVLAPLPPPPDPRLGFALPADPANPQTLRSPEGIERREVDYAAGDDGFLGSPAGGKTTLDIAYLAPALRHGLRVRDLCEARAILRDGDAGAGRWRVTFRDHRTGRTEDLAAGRVILAAGTLNTLRLLFASRAARGLRGLPRLGHRFGTNGDLFGFWDCNVPGTNLGQGLPSAGGLQLRDDPSPPVIGGGGFPSIDAYPLPRSLRERIRRGYFIAGIGEDAMDGLATADEGRLRVAYDPAGSPIFARLRTTFAEIARRTGQPIHCPRTPITVHPLGGACLAQDERRGVVGRDGQIFGNPGLYVTDAAALPRPPGGPPSLTIAAWAEHVAQGLIADAGRG